MNPNTTAQRKTTKTAGKTNGRRRGAVAHILDGATLAAAARKVLAETRPDLTTMLIDTVTVEHDGKLLIATGDNCPAVLDREGVGCFAAGLRSRSSAGHQPRSGRFPRRGGTGRDRGRGGPHRGP